MTNSAIDEQGRSSRREESASSLTDTAIASKAMLLEFKRRKWLLWKSQFKKKQPAA